MQQFIQPTGRPVSPGLFGGGVIKRKSFIRACICFYRSTYVIGVSIIGFGKYSPCQFVRRPCFCAGGCLSHTRRKRVIWILGADCRIPWLPARLVWCICRIRLYRRLGLDRCELACPQVIFGSVPGIFQYSSAVQAMSPSPELRLSDWYSAAMR